MACSFNCIFFNHCQDFECFVISENNNNLFSQTIFCINKIDDLEKML